MTTSSPHSPAPLRITLPDEAATAALAQRFAPVLVPGDVLLLSGPIGVGKTAFARALIRAAMDSPTEDVPSPTFTLVQTYASPQGDIWHSDLYRLGSADEIFELGIDEAMNHAICLIEWPERLGDLAPTDALTLAFSAGPESHCVKITGPSHWQKRLEIALA